MKLVLFAYSRGIGSSRGTERACREQVTFIVDAMGVDVLIPDNGMRKRDARFAGQEVHKAEADPLYDKNPARPEGTFRPKDFSGTQATCKNCRLREQCLRYPERSPVRQVVFFAKNQASPLKYTEAMKQRINSPAGHALYRTQHREAGAPWVWMLTR